MFANDTTDPNIKRMLTIPNLPKLMLNIQLLKFFYIVVILD